jgi:hypothetical protein
MMEARLAGLLAAAAWLATGPAARLSAQAAPAPAKRPACLLVIENVDRQGVKEETPGGANYYAGGNVRIRCGASRMASDSVAVFGGNVARFLGTVRYEDSTLAVTADSGTYYKDGERWEARGRVVARNTETGSEMQGPALDYLRPVAGVRDTFEMLAIGRPRIVYATKDSAGKPAEPYRIIADRVHMRGNDQVWGGGTVTVDRSDFAARADSMTLDTGPKGEGALLGTPAMKGLGADTFDLTGARIDLKLQNHELTYVTARQKAHAVTNEWDLTADAIGLDVNARKLEGTAAWGKAVARSKRYDVTADSLAIDTPGQRLTALRAFGHAWLGGTVDSTTKERDWLTGDTVRAAFVPRDSAGKPRSALQRMEALGHGRAFHQARPKDGGAPSLNYVRGDTIVITMRPPQAGEGARGEDTVDRVDVHGHVDGLQLEPKGRGGSRGAPASSAPASRAPASRVPAAGTPTSGASTGGGATAR